MSHVTASRRPAMQNRAWQQGALRFAEGGKADDIEAYEKRRDRVSRQSPDVQSMTHVGDKPRRPVEVDTGYFGKVGAGDAPYDVAGPLGGALTTAYGLKTLPLYMTPAAPLAAASDLAEGFASGDPLQAGLGALGTPGRGVKAAGTAAAAMMPSDAEAMFLGFGKAKAPPLPSLRMAEALKGRVPREDLWVGEGVYYGKDGKPRWELSDHRARLNLPPEGAPAVSLDKAREHPELWDQYPDVGRDLRVGVKRFGDFKTQGSFNPATGEIFVSPYALSPDQTIAHETQHAIQEAEGFTAGAAPGLLHNYEWMPKYVRGQQLLEKANKAGGWGALTPDEADEMNAIYKEATQRQSDKFKFDRYERSAGEAEARNAMYRMKLDDWERRQMAPWQTMDRPESELILHPDARTMVNDINRWRSQAQSPTQPHISRLMDYARELGAR